jgi:hypothetical protein
MLGFLAISFSDVRKRRAERRRGTIGGAIPQSKAVESGYVEHSSSPTDTVRKNTIRGGKASAMPSCHQLLKDAPNLLKISCANAPKSREYRVFTHEFEKIDLSDPATDQLEVNGVAPGMPLGRLLPSRALRRSCAPPAGRS